MEPQMNADERRLNEKSERIIASAFKVSNTLGCGFLEKVYENAMAHELRKTGFNVETQKAIRIAYDGVIVGEYIADLLIDHEIVIETKAIRGVDDIHLAQCLNYLRATGLKLCLLINFGGTKVSVKRIVNNL